MLIDFVPTDTTIFGSCHHSRSHEYYFKSILYPTGFVGYPCETDEDFKSVSIAAWEQMTCKENYQDTSHTAHLYVNNSALVSLS